MKLSEQAVIVFALGLQKVLALDMDYGEMIKEFNFTVNKNKELEIENVDMVRITKEDFEEKFGSFDSDDEDENGEQIELFDDKFN